MLEAGASACLSPSLLLSVLLQSSHRLDINNRHAIDSCLATRVDDEERRAGNARVSLTLLHRSLPIPSRRQSPSSSPCLDMVEPSDADRPIGDQSATNSALGTGSDRPLTLSLRVASYFVWPNSTNHFSSDCLSAEPDPLLYYAIGLLVTYPVPGACVTVTTESSVHILSIR